MDRCELAWAAGFFDGEGWAAASRHGRGDKRRPQARVNQAGAAGIPPVLLRLQSALGGLGRIGGPRRQDNRIDLYHWQISSRSDLERLLELVTPWLGHVKLAQLAVTLDRPIVGSETPTRSDEWRAWAAGLFDGEGSVYLLDHRSHTSYRIAEMAITQSSEAGVPEVLERFTLITGAGHINGPYHQKDANLDVYRLKVVVREGIEGVLATLWPWLGLVKRAQASAVLDVIRSQPDLPRGRPDWGNRKSHCTHGHEYATNRLRPYVPRGVGVQPRDNEQCLQCAREQARARRREQQETGDR